MPKRNIVLIGFMGAGKSLVAKRLGEILKKKVISTDELIIQQEGLTITQIFDRMGEPYFRQVEKEIVQEISREVDAIIDTGGGVVINQANIDKLKENGVLICLAGSPETLLNNIKVQAPNRPLLKGDNPLSKIKELLEQRKDQYAQANYIIDIDGKSMDQIVKRIQEIIKDA